MTIELRTIAEQNAMKAEALPAFGGFNLLHVKREVDVLLGLIGREGIFDQYSRHDISHVDAMLSILDWIIPEKTKIAMTPADWLLTVLGVYFHDLGLLVTKHEFRERGNSGFPRFCEEHLFVGPEGEDYRARVQEMYPDQDDRDRFLYQEFVRQTHAHRIYAWIVGNASSEFGVSHSYVSEVNRLLRGLDKKFRNDVALVCESHHLNDLNDTRKYRVSEPYGNSADETANVQYAAVLLRTADLLHITKDRVPSITFRIINPTDPTSQAEWAKQLGVRSVRPQLGRDSEGNLSPSALKEVIEVHASFDNATGFFGLTSYLAYAASELKKSNEWVEVAKKRGQPNYEFPWKTIDDSNVEASGFLPQPFSFELDQEKILDLLTGHTLYNDTGVVLRELVQNAIDAVRLQASIEEGSGKLYRGRVDVSWNTAERTLIVTDNGTGMTQEIIEKHLLRVGSSRYQDPEFIRRHPDFSAISRFGIGVLSCFMIADEVEIVTCHPDDEEGRHISLRSVHGKYLVRLLDKSGHPEAQKVYPNGTIVRLRLRPSAKMVNVVSAARRWIVLPGCDITVTLDESRGLRIGYQSPRDALADALVRLGYAVEGHSSQMTDISLIGRRDRRNVKIVEKTCGAVTLAYAVEWHEYFREWTFLAIANRSQRVRDNDAWEFGTCVEGIRVESNTPAYDGMGIAAIANASGVDAPKTNVARSGLEDTPERTAMLSSIYAILAEHIKNEVEQLHSQRGFSLTWATQEVPYLLSPVDVQSGEYAKPLNRGLLLEQLAQIPALLVERDGARVALSAEEIKAVESFWIVESGFLRSAEQLLRESPGSVSLQTIIDTFFEKRFELPEGMILSSPRPSPSLAQIIFERREISEIRAYPTLRRIDLKWSFSSEPLIWRQSPLPLDDFALLVDSSVHDVVNRRLGLLSLYVGRRMPIIHGLTDEIGIRAMGHVYLFSGTPLANYLNAWLDRVDEEPTDADQEDARSVFAVVTNLIRSSGIRTEQDIIEIIRELMPRSTVDAPWVPELAKALSATPLKIFDPSVWRRNNSSEV